MTEEVEKRKRGRKKKQKDPLDVAIGVGKSVDQSFLDLVMASVSYAAFHSQDTPLSLPRFESLRLLAMIDSFYGFNDFEIIARIPDRFPNLTTLTEARLHPSYGQILSSVRDSAARLSAISTMDELAQETEGMMSREIVGMALRSKSVRDRANGAREIVDRRSAKKGRPNRVPNALHLHLPESAVHSLSAALEMMKQMGEGEPEMKRIGSGRVISGSLVNVPANNPS